MIRKTIKHVDDIPDFEEFYAQSESRRLSEEINFGCFWTDKVNTFYEVSWIIDTGELYLFLFPDGYLNLVDTYGSFMTDEERYYCLEHAILLIDIIPTESEIRKKLLGWEEAMLQPNSIEWLYERFPVTRED